jgi:AcrR family transcriptional regulator
VSAEQGLRERKKERTRLAIAEAARRLFMERGFDAVTVAEVARTAEVSEGTVFNYFPTKEDLFYSGMESFEAQLVEAIRERPASQSVLAAFRGYVLERSRGLETGERADVIIAAARIVNASPTLQAREREIVAHYTHALAALLAEETSVHEGDIEPLVVAHALMGVQRALVEHVRTSVLSGVRGPKLVSDVRAQGKRAFARLERGLGNYGIKRR